MLLGSCTGASDRARALADAELHYKLGDGHFRDREVSQAIRELVFALKADPNHSRAHHLMGFLYIGRRDYDQALSHLRRAVEIDPGFLQAQNNLGTCYLALCRWDEAAGIFRSLTGNPLYQTPYIAENNLGLALFHKGRSLEASRHFQRSVFLNPRFCVGHNNLGMALIELDRPEEALAALGKALAADPECKRSYAEPHLHMGRARERLGQIVQALQEFRLCRELAGVDVPLGHGCGHTPVGLRCEQKLKQLESLSRSPGHGER